MTTVINGTTGIDKVVDNTAGMVPIGGFMDFAGTTAPANYLACPTTQTNISRTTYAKLFAAIGTAWGVGDGTTTFGMPFFENGLPALQGTPGAKFAGSVQAHIHLINQPNGATSVGGTVYGNPGATGGTNSASGDNMPAGRGVLKCVRYQ